MLGLSNSSVTPRHCLTSCLNPHSPNDTDLAVASTSAVNSSDQETSDHSAAASTPTTPLNTTTTNPIASESEPTTPNSIIPHAPSNSTPPVSFPGADELVPPTLPMVTAFFDARPTSFNDDTAPGSSSLLGSNVHGSWNNIPPPFVSPAPVVPSAEVVAAVPSSGFLAYAGTTTSFFSSQNVRIHPQIGAPSQPDNSLNGALTLPSLNPIEHVLLAGDEYLSNNRTASGLDHQTTTRSLLSSSDSQGPVSRHTEESSKLEMSGNFDQKQEDSSFGETTRRIFGDIDVADDLVLENPGVISSNIPDVVKTEPEDNDADDISLRSPITNETKTERVSMPPPSPSLPLIPKEEQVDQPLLLDDDRTSPSLSDPADVALAVDNRIFSINVITPSSHSSPVADTGSSSTRVESPTREIESEIGRGSGALLQVSISRRSPFVDSTNAIPSSSFGPAPPNDSRRLELSTASHSTTSLSLVAAENGEAAGHETPVTSNLEVVPSVVPEPFTEAQMEVIERTVREAIERHMKSLNPPASSNSTSQGTSDSVDPAASLASGKSSSDWRSSDSRP